LADIIKKMYKSLQYKIVSMPVVTFSHAVEK